MADNILSYFTDTDIAAGETFYIDSENLVYCAYNETDLYLSHNDLSSDSTYGEDAGYTCDLYIGINGSGYNKSTCTTITILDTLTAIDYSYYFQGFQKVTTINNLDKIDTSNATTLEGMFYWDGKLEGTLNLSTWNTDNVTDLGMYALFYQCSSLEVINIANFNTSNITMTSDMFNGCTSLKTIIAQDFDTTNITDSLKTFGGNTNLVGAIPYDSSKTTIDYANNTTGYFTAPSKAYIRTIKDDEKTIYPQTVLQAVQNMAGVSLDVLLNNLQNNKANIDSLPTNLSELTNDAGYVKSEIVTATLSASDWNAREYSFESTYPSSTYNISVELNGDSATDEQINAWIEANMIGSYGANIIYAMGTIPTIDIDVMIKTEAK